MIDRCKSASKYLRKANESRRDCHKVFFCFFLAYDQTNINHKTTHYQTVAMFPSTHFFCAFWEIAQKTLDGKAINSKTAHKKTYMLNWVGCFFMKIILYNGFSYSFFSYWYLLPVYQEMIILFCMETALFPNVVCDIKLLLNTS